MLCEYVTRENCQIIRDCLVQCISAFLQEKKQKVSKKLFPTRDDTQCSTSQSEFGELAADLLQERKSVISSILELRESEQSEICSQAS